MKSDEDYRTDLNKAKAIGQEPFLKQASPERILTWSDPEVFTNRQTVTYEQTTPIVIQVSDKLRERLAG